MPPNENQNENHVSVREIAELTVQLKHNTEAVENLTNIIQDNQKGLVVEHALVKEAIDFGCSPSLAQRVKSLETYFKVAVWILGALALQLLFNLLSFLGNLLTHNGSLITIK